VFYPLVTGPLPQSLLRIEGVAELSEFLSFWPEPKMKEVCLGVPGFNK